MKKKLLSLFTLSLLFTSCTTTNNIQSKNNIKPTSPKENAITLLFAGDVMAHNVNYNMKDYKIIWDDVLEEVTSADFAFANIEAPLDTTKPASNYPYFNMPENYVQSAINAGFNVFSLCNNHTNDQELSGIKETQKTADRLTEQEAEKGNSVYFAGIKEGKDADYTWHIIEKNGWKILFLPMTEILNRPLASTYINYISSSKTKRKAFTEYCKKLREENECDLFILSWHANETEYIRTVTESQKEFYQDLLNAGVDIIWANHAHIIKNRKVIINSETENAKIIMYANGNTISGQRTKPDLKSKNPIEERDNTGDGLFYKVTFTKDKKTNQVKFKNSENIFVTTYITPERNFIIYRMNQQFIDFLNEQGKTDWATYIEKRKHINETYTKEITEWQ